MKEIFAGLDGFMLLQAPNSTPTQMMGYVLTSPSGKVLVIDGGNPGDADFLREQILARGGHVDTWLLTHCHADHCSALTEILADPQGVTIGCICYNFPSQSWLDKTEPHRSAATARIFSCLAQHSALCRILHEKDVLDFDGARIDVLTDAQPLPGSMINDSSLVFRFTFPGGKTALFLGDLEEPARNLLAARYGETLKSDIVQMAHHGQGGVSENVYRLVRPEICLWCAPDWLWNNDRGQGFNTGPYKTVSVRCWMGRQNVRIHAAEYEGPVVIR